MRDAMKRAEPHISRMVAHCRQEGFPCADLAMHIAVLPPGGFLGNASRIVADGVMVAPCPFSGFRTMPVSGDPIMFRLLKLEGTKPDDLVVMLTHSNVGFIGHAKADFGTDPLACIGAL